MYGEIAAQKSLGNLRQLLWQAQLRTEDTGAHTTKWQLQLAPEAKGANVILKGSRKFHLNQASLGQPYATQPRVCPAACAYTWGQQRGVLIDDSSALEVPGGGACSLLQVSRSAVLIQLALPCQAPCQRHRY